MNSRIPTEIFHELHGFVKKYDADGQAELFAENGVWEFPFASGNIPRKIEGRENIRAFGQRGMETSKNAGRRIVKYNSINIYKTTKDDTIIAEFELEGEVLDNKKNYKIPYIQLLKVKNGKIILLQDYFPIEILRNLPNTNKNT